MAHALVGLGEVGHGVIHTGEILPRQVRIARILGAAGEQHRVELVVERGEAAIDADIDAAMEDHALGFHLLHAPLDVVLLHLEVRDAVAQESAGLRLTLKHMYLVPHAGELLGRCHAGRA